MKKRIFVLILTLCTVLSFSVSALAVEQQYDYGGYIAPSADNIWNKEVHPYGIVVGSYLIVSDKPLGAFPRDNGKITICSWGNSTAERYVVVDGKWTFNKSYDDTGLAYTTQEQIRWANENVYLADVSYKDSGANHFLGTILKLAGVDFEDWADYYGALTKQITVQNVVAVLVVGSTAVIGLVFLWWGSRKAVRAIMSAFRKGRISL